MTFGIFCMVVCILSLMTFLLTLKEKDSLKYPERATVYILFSHLIISIVLLTGVARNKQVGCHEINGQHYKVQGNNNRICTVLHMLLLYFFIASQIWCIIYAVGIYLISKVFLLWNFNI